MARTYLTNLRLGAFLLLLSLPALSSSIPPLAHSAAAPAATVLPAPVGNRAPLMPSPLIKLAPGAVRPEGWLLTQLQNEAKGFVGHIDEVGAWGKFDGSAWASVNGKGAYGWEELPYWLKGYMDLAYVLQDPALIAKARMWTDRILLSQRPDGYFGPEENRAQPDLWPNMLALSALRSQYEATADPRIIPFMLRYYRWMNNLELNRVLPESWQKQRGGDNLDSIYWLYNRTGQAWLLGLARVNHERTSDWVGGIPSMHGVNFAQGFREPAEYFQQTRDPRYLAATEHDFNLMVNKYGQVPGGLYGADENARDGHTGPRQAAETCAMVEMMFSDEMLMGITGQAIYGDRCEDVAFNSLPAATTADGEGLHYLTAPNLVQLDRHDKSPMIQNGGDMFSYNPFDYRCCQHNVAMGWPYFAERLWMATPGGGLAAVLYAPNTVTARVNGGSTVTIREVTQYPFSNRIEFHLSMAKPTTLGLKFRVPHWCLAPSLQVGGSPATPAVNQGGWITISGRFKNSETIVLTLPMPITVHRWSAQQGAVSVYRGPLSYSVKIGEKWTRWGGTDRWPAFEVYPTTPWSYALVVNAGAPTATIKSADSSAALPAQPFIVDETNALLTAQARRVPGWGLEPNGLIQALPGGVVHTAEPIEQITLIPMGCARLRLSVFPVAAEASAGR